MTAVPSPRQTLDDIALCLVFFTRLPLPVFDFRGRALAAAGSAHTSYPSRKA